MPILQLDPAIPVFVVADATAKRAWPTGTGFCIAWTDYSQEHFCLWKIVFDEGGEVWDVPQSHVRLAWNISLRRRPRQEGGNSAVTSTNSSEAESA